VAKRRPLPETRKLLVRLHCEIKTPPFSRNARIEAGTLLGRLQNGETLSMPQSRPMPSIGPRCHELRITDDKIEWRILYRIDGAAIIIAEIFRKTTQKTPVAMIEISKRRLRIFDQDIG
jgi:phage-related protein